MKKHFITGLRTPCQQINFNTSAIANLFQNSLPQYITDMRSKWEDIRCTTVSGLAPTYEGGPLDDCTVAGAWCSQQQRAHGGPIPFMSGAAGSNGVQQDWPYSHASATSWTQTGYGMYCSSRKGEVGTAISFANEDCHDMDWGVGRPRTALAKKDISRWFDEAGHRLRPWRPHKGRAGAKRHRSNKQGDDDNEKKGFRDPDIIKVFFANVTSCSEKAKL